MSAPAPAVPEWLLSAAHYRRNGWRDVFPLPAGKKHPPPTGYTGYAGAPVEDMALASWAGDGSYGNLGLRLPAGVLGIDVDAYDGKEGRATIARLEREWGRLPDTWRSTARWPDDGDSGIRMFRVPPGLAWRNPGPGVESIHVGWRYAVVAPSRHPSGRRYCWVDEDTLEVHADGLPVAVHDLPELPDAWVRGLSDGPAVERVKGDAGEVPVEWATPGTCLRATRQLAAGLSALNDPGQESRHDLMLGVTLALVGYGSRGHGGVAHALSALHAEFIRVMEPVRGRSVHSEWERLLHGAVAVVSAEDRVPEVCHGPDCEPGKVREVPDWLVDLAAAPRATVPLSEVSGTVSLETPDGIDPVAWRDAVGEWVREKLPRVDWKALWADDEPQEWIVEPLLPARRLVALYSAPKVGKSLLLLELAASIACGREVLGVRLPRPRVVLYVDFENDPKADVRERLQAMDFEPEHLENLCYLSFPSLAALDSEQGSLELMAAVHHYGAELVVIDTVSRSVAGDENENDTWLSFYRHTGLKLKQAGVALIRLDHAGKDESKGQRGGSAKVGDVDAVWRMSRITDDTFRLECEANRMPVTEKMLTLKRLEDPALRHKVEAKGNLAAYTAELDKWRKVLADNGLLTEPGVKATYTRLKELKEAGHITEVVPKRWIEKVREHHAAQPRPFEWSPS